MTSVSKNNGIVKVASVLAMLLLLAGCGKQDLYAPPGAPVEIVGRLPMPSQSFGVAAFGDYAFVGGGQAGLHTVDISDPTNPVLLATVGTNKTAEYTRCVRTFFNNQLQDFALTMEESEGFLAIEVTDPMNPVNTGFNTQSYWGYRFAVDRSADATEPYRVFVAEGYAGIRVAEVIADNSGGHTQGILSSSLGIAKGLDIVDNWVYVADDEMGLSVMDFSEASYDPSQGYPVVANADSPGWAEDVAIEGDYAFVADGWEGFTVFRIDAGETPVLVTNLDLSGYCQNIEVRDHLVGLASRNGGTHFLDVTDPAAPILLGTIVTSDAADLAFGEDGLVLVIDRDEGLVVLGGRGAFTDHTPPSPIMSLEAEGVNTTAMYLSWYATGDDYMMRPATSIEVRRSATPIEDETAWADATPVDAAIVPEAPGEAMALQVDDLDVGAVYHFAAKVTDDAGNVSALSNSASDTTLSGLVLMNGQVDVQIGTVDDTYTYEVIYLFPEAPAVAKVFIDDDTEGEDMTLDTAYDGFGDRYIHATTLSQGGDHTYYFYFEATGSDPYRLPVDDGTTFEGPGVGAVAFMMGSPDTEVGRDADETLHRVAFAAGLLVSPHEVTQAEWEAQGFTNNSVHVGDDLPVQNVSWLEAVQYCNELTANDDDVTTAAYDISGDIVTPVAGADGWRLPTEAEWEYACRAGTATAYYDGDITFLNCIGDDVLDGIGWYCANAGTAAHEVGGKTANADGLYDMSGNVREWCWDWYGEYPEELELDPRGPDSGTRRVVRGGSWYVTSQDCRSAAREGYYPDSTDDTIGLRVVRTVDVD